MKYEKHYTKKNIFGDQLQIFLVIQRAISSTIMTSKINSSFLPHIVLPNNLNKNQLWEFPLLFSGLQTQLVSMRMQAGSLALLSGLRIQCCHELWLWCRLVAVAPIRPLAWEPPYAAHVALKSKKKKKKKNHKKQTNKQTNSKKVTLCPTMEI